MVISYDDEDDAEEETLSDVEEEYEIDDQIPYGDEVWYMDDGDYENEGIDLEGPQFAHENEFWIHMEHGPPKKRRRITPL